MAEQPVGQRRGVGGRDADPLPLPARAAGQRRRRALARRQRARDRRCCCTRPTRCSCRSSASTTRSTARSGSAAGCPAIPGDYRYKRARSRRRAARRAAGWPARAPSSRPSLGELPRVFAKDLTTMQPGDVFVAQYNGGGGYGDPLDARRPSSSPATSRPARSCRADGRSEQYGVVLARRRRRSTPTRRRRRASACARSAWPPRRRRPRRVGRPPRARRSVLGTIGGARRATASPTAGEPHWACPGCGQLLGADRRQLQGRRGAAASAARRRSTPTSTSTRPSSARTPSSSASTCARRAASAWRPSCAWPDDPPVLDVRIDGPGDGDVMTGSYMIGVDIGGTFTDCVVMDERGRIATGKSPTTPDDRSRGFFDSIERAADAIGTDLGVAAARLPRGSSTARRRAPTRSSSGAARASGCWPRAGHEDGDLRHEGHRPHRRPLQRAGARRAATPTSPSR